MPLLPREGPSEPIFTSLGGYLPFIADGFAVLDYHDRFGNLNHSHRWDTNFREKAVPNREKKVKIINSKEKKDWHQSKCHIPICNSTLIHRPIDNEFRPAILHLA